MNLYVSNLSSSVNDDDLKKLFAEFGNVVSAKIVLDRATGRSRGFGFVEMTSDNAAKAINGLNGKMKDGKSISVSEARPRVQ
jgi:RNA recognition motif-containing protein